MSMIVDCNPGILMTAGGSLTHLCPHKNEVDDGTVRVSWTTVTGTFELHALAAHLRTYRQRKIAHEALVRELTDALVAAGGRHVRDVNVSFEYQTAGLTGVAVLR